jgi:hypothetical protein
VNNFTDITSALNLLGLGGLAIFIIWTIKGLNQRISALTQLAKEQSKTLETVRSRAQEFEKLSEGYKKALLDFEEMGEKIERKRGELVKELEEANKRKDSELIRYKELQLAELSLKEQSLAKVTELEKSLGGAVTELQKQLQILAPGSWLSRGSKSQVLSYLLTFSDFEQRGLRPRTDPYGLHALMHSPLLHDIGHRRTWLDIQSGREENEVPQDKVEDAQDDEDGQQDDSPDEGKAPSA